MNSFELSKSQKGEKYTETSLHGFSSQALVAQLEEGVSLRSAGTDSQPEQSPEGLGRFRRRRQAGRCAEWQSPEGFQGSSGRPGSPKM